MIQLLQLMSTAAPLVPNKCYTWTAAIMPESEVFQMSFLNIYHNYGSGPESRKYFEIKPLCFPCRGSVVS